MKVTVVEAFEQLGAVDTRTPRPGDPPRRRVGGHNKALRPDLKEFRFILTITADGAVPIDYRVADVPGQKCLGDANARCTALPAYDMRGVNKNTLVLTQPSTIHKSAKSTSASCATPGIRGVHPERSVQVVVGGG